jgi:energy-coupling factor transport system substrate-specific component
MVNGAGASQNDRTQVLALIPLGVALNLALGTIIHTLKLPVYIDAVGTVVVTLLVGLRAGVVVGVASFLIGGLLINPVLPWFCGTQAAIAIYTHSVGRRGGFQTLLRTLLSGIGLGVVAGIVSAPVIVYLFGGITGSGASLVVAFLLASGKSILQSVVMSGLAAEPLDKTLQCLLAVWIIGRLPPRLLERFNGGSLSANGFIGQ